MGIVYFILNVIITWEFFKPLAIFIGALVLCVNVWFAFKLIDMLT